MNDWLGMLLKPSNLPYGSIVTHFRTRKYRYADNDVIYAQLPALVIMYCYFTRCLRGFGGYPDRHTNTPASTTPAA